MVLWVFYVLRFVLLLVCDVDASNLDFTCGVCFVLVWSCALLRFCLSIGMF